MQKSASFWYEKAWWCQPSTIVLTGISVVSVSWWWPHNIWITGLLAIGIIAWWLLFLVVIPNAYLNQLQDEVKEVHRD